MTYLIAGEVFPTHVRSMGAGFAAAVAKMGAVMTAFLFPLFHDDIGSTIILRALVGTSLLGAVMTWLARIEGEGRSLESV
jgi:MFS transporter, putative metabolite transport protein